MSNTKRHILITGGSGLLALNWAITERNGCSVSLGLHDRQVKLRDVNSVPINLESVDQLCKIFETIKPDLIIHTAGLTSVEACEKDPELAKDINIGLAANVAKATKRLGINLVHISTDHLFDGENKNVDEDQPVSPLNVYGQTKAEAEKEILSIHSKALVIRTNFYGWGPAYRQSFSDMIIMNLRENKKIFLFDDVFYTSVLAETLINTTHELIDKHANGIYHVVGDERISKYEFGLKVAASFNLNSDLVIPVSIKSNPHLVKRPLDMSLSNSKVCRFLGKRIGTTEQHIQRLNMQEQLKISEEIIKL